LSTLAMSKWYTIDTLLASNAREKLMFEVQYSCKNSGKINMKFHKKNWW